MTGRKAWVYGLISSDNKEEIRYIGVSIDPQARLKNHIWSVNWRSEKNGHKINWINSVLRDGHSVEVTLLAEFDSEHEAYATEDAFIIEYHRRGHPLTNLSKGGRGGVLVSDDKLDEFYRKRAELQATEEHRLKLSTSRLKALSDPEKRERLMQHVALLNSDPLKSEKISKGLKQAAKSNDFRAKANATRRLPENREKARTRAKVANSTEEAKSVSSVYAKRGWDSLTPDQRRDRILKTKLGVDFRKAKLNGWVLSLTPISHTCKDTQ